MRKIITPALPGQAKFEIYRNMNGGVDIRVHDHVVHLSPREGYDAGLVLLQCVGAVFAEVPRFPGDLNGKELMATLKMDFQHNGG